MSTLAIIIIFMHMVIGQRYIIDNDNDLNRYIAFPIDVCFKGSAFGAKYLRYSCSKTGNSVEKRVYQDSECNSPTDVDSFSSTDTSPCGGPVFSCNGSQTDDQYITSSYYPGSDCSAAIASIPISMGCYCDTATTSYHISCSVVDSGTYSGQMIDYVNDATCNSASHIAPNGTTDISKCYLAYQYQQTVDIYAKIEQCALREFRPTTAPTLPPGTLDGTSQIEFLGELYKITLGGFCGIFGVIVLLSWLDAWYFRINDYFSIGAILQMVFQTIDMVSDCFFTAELSVQYKTGDKVEFEVMLYLSMLFIVLPAVTALFQLYFYAKKHWLGNDYVRAWLSKYSAFLLVMAMLTGSSFSAVALLNSYIFQIEIFDMGLTYKELRRFNTRRIWSVVVLENIPQLALQSAYFVVQGNGLFENNGITLSSMVFSVVSIIISLMSLTMEKTINKTQRSVTISMDITGDCVETASSKCRTMSYKLRRLLAPMIGVDWNVIEVVKPMYVTGGLALDIIIYVNESRRGAQTADYGKLLNEANEKGKLQNLIKEAWQLSDVPLITHIQYKLMESKQDKSDRKNTLREMEKTATDSQFNPIEYNATAATSVSSRDRIPTASVVNNNSNNHNNNNEAPPPVFNPNAKKVNRKKSKADAKSQIEIEMESNQLMAMDDEGIGMQNEGEGAAHVIVAEGADIENDKLVENLVRMGYKNRENNKIAIGVANGDINVAIQYLKNINEEKKAKKVAFQVQGDDEAMPPPPKYNAKARKASNAKRKNTNT